MNIRQIVTVLIIILLISSIFFIECKKEREREMKIIEYLKGVLEKLKYDESGQLGNVSSHLSSWTPKTKKVKKTPVLTGQNLLNEYLARHGYALTPSPNLGGSTIPYYEKTTQKLGEFGGVAQQPSAQTPAQVYYQPPVYNPPVYTGGGGGVEFPTYEATPLNLTVPTFGWSPTAEQIAGYEAEAARRAALVYEPQREELARQLEQYRSSVASQKETLGREYDIQSRAIANIVQNSVKQAIIEDAIRRGATTGGEMTRQLAGAGRLETQQRREIEQERAAQYATLAKTLDEYEKDTGNRITSLTQLQGEYGALVRQELENTARDWAYKETGSRFQAELEVAKLQNAIEAAEYEAQYNQALFRAQQQQQEWENQFNVAQANYQAQQQAYENALAARGDPLAALQAKYLEAQIRGKDLENKSTEEWLRILQGLSSSKTGYNYNVSPTGINISPASGQYQNPINWAGAIGGVRANIIPTSRPVNLSTTLNRTPPF